MFVIWSLFFNNFSPAFKLFLLATYVSGTLRIPFHRYLERQARSRYVMPFLRRSLFFFYACLFENNFASWCRRNVERARKDPYRDSSINCKTIRGGPRTFLSTLGFSLNGDQVKFWSLKTSASLVDSRLNFQMTNYASVHFLANCYDGYVCVPHRSWTRGFHGRKYGR